VRALMGACGLAGSRMHCLASRGACRWGRRPSAEASERASQSRGVARPQALALGVDREPRGGSAGGELAVLLDTVAARRRVGGRSIGALEGEVLEVLWATPGWLTGREVFERLPSGTRAYTTVMTVLGRLVDKSLVERREEGSVHRYRAAGDPDELTAQAIHELLDAAADPRLALARFVEGLDDPALVAELDTVLKRRRRR
jgi:predicted transcriptional regulator